MSIQRALDNDAFLIRSAYDGQRVQVAVNCEGDPGRTKQSQKDQCDINFIMAKYLKSGNVDHLAKYQGRYGYAEAITYREALDTVIRAEEMFADLPSEVRTRFDNNPEKFLEFAQDEKNLPEMRKLKLAHPEIVKEPPPSKDAPK